VIPDRSEPAVAAEIGCRKHTRQIGPGVHVARTDPDRRQCRGGRAEVDVVVVQAGDDGSARGVVDVLAA
jgi:hypothetical protein